MNLKTLTDEELGGHLNAVLTEQERRKDLDEIPEQIRELTAKYLAGGGKIEELEVQP